MISKSSLNVRVVSETDHVEKCPLLQIKDVRAVMRPSVLCDAVGDSKPEISTQFAMSIIPRPNSRTLGQEVETAEQSRFGKVGVV